MLTRRFHRLLAALLLAVIAAVPAGCGTSGVIDACPYVRNDHPGLVPGRNAPAQ